MEHNFSPIAICLCARMKCGSLVEVARKTGIKRSTLIRILNGSTIAPHAATVAKLLKVIND